MDTVYTINKVGQNAVVLVTREDGETPCAYTFSQIRDWMLELIGDDEDKKLSERVLIVNGILDRIEDDLINPI